MSYTLGEAAKATGKSKTTIQRAIKNSRISATKDEATGEWCIDPAELHREFPALTQEQVLGEKAGRSVTGDTVSMLQAELERERQERQRERSQLEGTVADLREDRDRWRTQAERLLLTDQRAAPATAPKARGWWFGRRESA